MPWQMEANHSFTRLNKGFGQARELTQRSNTELGFFGQPMIHFRTAKISH